ncbi:MAG: 2-amino-4-hydroxy-6-hydroxymethyldihydropteridine diphosphokinase [Chitinophagaceae bacterium]|nr:MAG: 2-amino-4-hydroxy-6-hydroxymethyldihydropteridine diphosphokinase [Chitinophagaceae bacterium]
MNKAYLLIGGNMGDREGYLSSARQWIEKMCGSIVNRSALYQTAAWGIENQEAFLNQALQIETMLAADELLKKLLWIEERIGRRRQEKYGPRIIDIDIVLFNDEIIHTEGLTIPHPQMQNRRFVLEPLNEIAADVIHPVLQKSIRQLLSECPDKLAVQKFQ